MTVTNLFSAGPSRNADKKDDRVNVKLEKQDPEEVNAEFSEDAEKNKKANFDTAPTIKIKQEPVSAKKTNTKEASEDNETGEPQPNLDKTIKTEPNDPEITFMNIGAESTPAKFKRDNLKHLSTASLSPMPYDTTSQIDEKLLETPGKDSKEDEGIVVTPASSNSEKQPETEKEGIKTTELSSIGNFSDFATDQTESKDEANTSQASKLTLISMGAPVPAALNGIKPPLENFSIGMGELIYFENLPNSTGVFERLRKVIKKIRRKLG
jgi:hypothetical protein